MAKKIAGITIEIDGDTSKLTKAIDAASKKIDGVAKGLQDVGGALSKYVTAPLAAVGGASVAAFNEVDEGLDTIIRKTGATGEAADKMQDILENVATTIPTDFKTAGEAIGEVSTRFGVTGDELETLSGQFIKFADLNNTDVSNSIDTVQKALSAYGLGAESAEGFLDRLNVVGQKTGVSVDKLSEGIVSNATAFKELGLDIDGAVTFMGQLETSGANSETVLNGMRKALKNATDQGIPLEQALSDLQNTILNGTGTMDGLTAAYDIFGKSGDQIFGAVRDGTIDFQNLVGTMTDAKDSVSSTFEETLDPADQFKTLLNEAKVAGAEVGGTLLEMVVPVLGQVRDIIEKVKEKWDSLSPETQQAIVKAAMIVAAVGPLISILGSVVGGIGSVISILGALASPVGIAIAAVAALIAIGVALYQNWDEIKEGCKQLGDLVKRIWEDIKTSVSNTVQNIKDKVTQTWTNITTTVTDKVNSIKTKIIDTWNNVKTTTTNVFNGIKDAITGKISDVYNAVTNKLQAIKDKFTSIFDGVKDTVSRAINFIKDLFSGEIDFPHFRLPHFNIDGGQLPWGIGGKGSPPHIEVEWYKKAMNQPFLLDSATIFGMSGNSLLGGGESGSEMIIGTNKLMQMIAQAKGGETVINNQFTINAADKDPQELASEISFYLDMELQRAERAFA